MENLLFKKIELWVLGLVMVAAFLGMVLFGAIVLDEERGEEELGGDHFGPIGDAALALAEIPENARQGLKTIGQPDPTMRAKTQTDMAGGWTWNQPPGSNGLNGFLLLSRYDGDQTRHVIELVSLASGETVQTWSPEPEMLLANVSRRAEFDRWVSEKLWTNTYFRFVHPYLTEEGELLLKDHNTPLFLLSVCGDIRWWQDEHLFHHSSNADGEGGFWVPSMMLGALPEKYSQRFVRDALARLNNQGQVTFKVALDEILFENDLGHLLFTGDHFYPDPMHLNDIEPVLTDGPYWKKGDLFLSLRNPSLVMLYRPSTEEVVWSQTGPWLTQHDVDILDDHRISVFSNNMYNLGLGPYVEGVSEVLIYDFETGTVESPFRDVLEQLNAIASVEGLQEFTQSGHLIYEETTRGRIFVLDASSKIVATYVNRAENGGIYTLGWSRYVPQLHGDKALRAIMRSGC